MNIVEVSKEDDIDDSLTGRVKKFCLKVLNIQGIDNWEVSLFLCNDKTIRELNKQYLNRNCPTDVLSFAQEDEFFTEHKIYLAGDIIISLENLENNARILGIDKNEGLKRLIIHGVLHLQGMEHGEDEKEQSMIELQEKILDKLTGERLL